jgi:hypothetical protein
MFPSWIVEIPDDAESDPLHATTAAPRSAPTS